MLNRKLLEILSRLEPAETKQLRLFLNSPYFTYGLSSQDIISLFEYIIQHESDEQSAALEKKTVNSALFPDKIFNEKGKSPIDTLTSDLLRLTKKFLFIQSKEQESSDAMGELPLAQFYRKFGLEERFWQSIQGMRKTMDKQKTRDENYFLSRYYLEAEVVTFKSLYNSSEDDANIGVEARYLEQFFTISRMEIACGMNHQRQMADFPLVYSQALAQELIRLIREGEFADNELAEIYLLVFDIINAPDDLEKIEQLKKQVEQFQSKLPMNHLSNLMAYLRVFQFRIYVKSGKKEYLMSYFELLTKHLDEGYLYTNGKVISHALRNITHMGLRLGAYEKVREILEKHPPERIGGTRYPVEFHNLNLANYHFALKNYEQVEEHLNYCNFENVQWSIQAEILQIKMYFETANELLESRIKALLQKVRRSKLSKDHKTTYFNFLNKLILIIKYGWEKNTPKRAKLADEIRTLPGLLEREWLLKQLE